MRTHSGGGKKREESLPFIIMDKIRILAMEKKKKTSRRLYPLQARNLLARITRVSSSDKVSPLDGFGIYQGIQLARI